MALGLRQIMCAPMMHKGTLHGIVYVDSRTVSQLDPERDLVMLEALAAHAAVAIESARLFREERRKGELMAMLAHEISNPLSAIIGFTDLAEHMRDTDPEAVFRYMWMIRDQSHRLWRLVRNILTLSRMEAGEAEWTVEPVSMAKLIHDAVGIMSPLAEAKQQSLDAKIAEDLPLALGNADRLVQVLTNLVANGIRYTPEGGSITVSASVEEVEAPKPAGPVDAWVVSPRLETGPVSFVRIEVEDTGPGIPEEDIENIFDKYVRVGTDEGLRHGAGTGLGLYIVREIVRQHAGEVWAESDDGGGSRFIFRIPVSQGARETD
jgi:two-component system phosphate regulon sensor histidine kinase PhoR